jgi:hypothetical protein
VNAHFEERRTERSAGASDCGLASAIIGATVFLASPLVAILAAQIWAHGDRASSVVELHAWLARIAVGIPYFLIVAGLWFGLSGLRHTGRERTASALPVAGLLLNVVALCGWTLAGIGLLNTTESMLELAR